MKCYYCFSFYFCFDLCVFVLCSCARLRPIKRFLCFYLFFICFLLKIRCGRFFMSVLSCFEFVFVLFVFYLLFALNKVRQVLYECVILFGGFVCFLSMFRLICVFLLCSSAHLQVNHLIFLFLLFCVCFV